MSKTSALRTALILRHAVRHDSSPFAAKVAKHNAEARDLARAANIAEPLLENLTPGKHVFPLEQFRALALYLLWEDGERYRTAIAKDAFKVATVEIVCDRDFGSGEMVTLSEFARRHCLPQKSVWRRVTKLGLKHLSTNREKLYDLAELNAHLVTISGRG